MDTIPLKSAVDVAQTRNKCLLKNWFEERKVCELKDKHILPSGINEMRYGHPGIFTLETHAQFSRESTFRNSYKPPVLSKDRKNGLKRLLLEQALSKEAHAKVMDEITPKPYKAEYKTITEASFHKDFVSEPPKPTRPHNFRDEQPVSYWTEKFDKIHGVSMTKSKNNIFHKNDAFSTPITVSLGEQQPYELSRLA